MAKLRTNKKAEEVEVTEVVVGEVEEVEKEKKPATKKKEEKKSEKETIDVIDKAVEKAATVEVVDVTKEVKAEPLVRISTNQDVRTYIGDQWYNLKSGKQVSVPKTVKEILRKAGYLTAL